MFDHIPTVRWASADGATLLRLVLVIAGVTLLIKGQALLRLFVFGALFMTGVAAGYALFRFAAAGSAPKDPWFTLVVSLLAGCVAAAAARFPRVSRWTEVVGTAWLALWLAPMVREAAGPTITWTLVLLLIVAGVVSRALLIGGLAGLCFMGGLGQTTWTTESMLVVFGLCMVASWLRFGRLPAESVELCGGHRRAGAFGLLASVSDQVPVIAAFDRDDQKERFLARCRRHHRAVHVFEGLPGIIQVSLPRFEAVLLQRLPSVASLVATTPTVVDKAQRRLEEHRPLSTATSAEISLEEIREILRTGSDHRTLRGRGTNGEGVHVALIDTGAEIRPEYADRIIDRKSVVPHEPDPTDNSDCRHGSNVAMIIATLAPAVRFLMLKAFTKEGYAELGWILNAMVVAVKEKADVINASFGGCHCRGANECVVCRAANGVPAVVCASAGNAGPGAGTLSCPGAARSAICTASSTRDGGISRFSSRGPSADITNPKPDVTGFGEGVVVRRSARGPNDTPTSGTSFAAPQATAAAACVISAAKSKNRRTDKNQVTTIIRRSARPSQLAKGHRHPDSSGAGMLSIADAVRCVLGKQGLSTRAWFPHSLCRPVPVAAATLALTAVLWWFGLDHANQLSTEHDGPVRLVGRVRTGPQQALVLDDGTDSVAIRWAEADTRPCAGSLIYLLGTWDGQTRSIAGGARFTLWPRQQPCGDSD